MITSVLFGVKDRSLTDAENMANYTEYAHTNVDNPTAEPSFDNKDVEISQAMEEDVYGLVITFEYRKFDIEVNTTMIADSDTDLVQDNDFVSLLLVHKTAAGVVDYAYSIDMKNGETYTFIDIFNGNMDVEYTSTNPLLSGTSLTKDEYGTYSLYIYYPMFYVNEPQYTIVTNTNESYNPTLIRLDNYTTYDTIAGINNNYVAFNYLGSFKLDTITRSISIDITITKSAEFWLHNTATNM